MTRNQMRAILQGARMALPYLAGHPRAEAMDAIENLDAALERGERRIRATAANYAELVGLRIEARIAMESAGQSEQGTAGPGAADPDDADSGVAASGAVAPDAGRSEVTGPPRPVLAEWAVVHALHALARADWDHVAESEAYLRRIAPDLMFEITVPVGQPPVPTTFAGRWLVPPDPATARRGGGLGSYRGVAETRQGHILVYVADVAGRRPAHLEEYADLAAAAGVLPAAVLRQASAAVIREFNRQAWLRDFNERRERVRQAWLQDGREHVDEAAAATAARAASRPEAAAHREAQGHREAPGRPDKQRQPERLRQPEPPGPVGQPEPRIP
jgi:hypothetical protein